MCYGYNKQNLLKSAANMKTICRKKQSNANGSFIVVRPSSFNNNNDLFILLHYQRYINIPGQNYLLWLSTTKKKKTKDV